MRNKDLKTPSSHPSLLPRLNFNPEFSSFDQHRGMGSENCCQFIYCLCLSFLLLTLFLHSVVQCLAQEAVFHKHFQHMLCFFMNSSFMDPFPGMQSFRNILLQHRCPHSITSPSSKPIPGWASLSTGPQIVAVVCFSPGFPHSNSLFGAHPSALAWSLSCAVGRYLLQC